MALDYAVIEYDKTTTDILSKLILLILPAPTASTMHFTGVSNIAATFNFQFNAGRRRRLPARTALMTPVLAARFREPDHQHRADRRRGIYPPVADAVQENKLTLLLRQGADVDLILRLLAGELRINGGKQQGIYYNKPNDAKAIGYSGKPCCICRRSRIETSCCPNRLMFEQHWTLPAES